MDSIENLPMDFKQVLLLLLLQYILLDLPHISWDRIT